MSYRIAELKLDIQFYTHSPVQVSLVVAASEVGSSPTLGDFKKEVTKLCRQIVELGLNFPRWKDSTCLECPEITGPQDEDESYQYT